jgi:hypothetical protein
VSAFHLHSITWYFVAHSAVIQPGSETRFLLNRFVPLAQQPLNPAGAENVQVEGAVRAEVGELVEGGPPLFFAIVSSIGKFAVAVPTCGELPFWLRVPN